MANPKRKHSHSRSRTVKAAIRKKPISLRSCERCGTDGRPHTVCDNCGFYAGRQIVDMDEA